MYNLDKKICLVTGGTGLIGSSIVKNLSSSGATVIFTFNAVFNGKFFSVFSKWCFSD